MALPGIASGEHLVAYARPCSLALVNTLPMPLSVPCTRESLPADHAVLTDEVTYDQGWVPLQDPWELEIS